MQQATLSTSDVQPAPPIRLLIVDDSLVARTVISRILGGHADLEIAGTAAGARQAIEMLGRMEVDIILLDVAMPGCDGIAALPELLSCGGGARVLMVSGSTADGAADTVRALTEGAIDTLLKPPAADFAGRFADTLVARLRRIGHARRAPAGSNDVPLAAERARAVPIQCIGLGASTGGPHALSTFFAALPAAVSAPIVVTQHLPAEFMPYFADQLAAISGRPVRIARDGEILRPGAVLVAPGHAHLRLVPGPDGARVRLDGKAAASGCLPSVDPMFASLAELFGPAALGVVFSGMGRDGLIGAGLMAERGGDIIVQDAASGVIWGMPGTIARAGLASAILPPEAIAAHIAERCARHAGAAAWR